MNSDNIIRSNEFTRKKLGFFNYQGLIIEKTPEAFRHGKTLYPTFEAMQEGIAARFSEMEEMINKSKRS